MTLSNLWARLVALFHRSKGETPVETTSESTATDASVTAVAADSTVSTVSAEATTDTGTAAVSADTTAPVDTTAASTDGQATDASATVSADVSVKADPVLVLLKGLQAFARDLGHDPVDSFDACLARAQVLAVEL